MDYQDRDRDPFEAFGTLEQPHEIDLAAPEAAPARIKTGFSWVAFGGGLAALGWVGAAVGLPLSYYGVETLFEMHPAMQAGLAALAFGPAILFWLGATAVGEAVKARRLAYELTRMAQKPAPAPSEDLNDATRISQSVRGEIELLNDAVAIAIERLGDLEISAQRNTALFGDAVGASRQHVEHLAGHLAQEREALAALNHDMGGQVNAIADTVGRQVRLMREASKLVSGELGAAEEAMETHAHSFSGAAAQVAERTAELQRAASDTHVAAASLTNTMGNVLDSLGEATKLTDAARQAADQATIAANETASAVRDTTQRAVFEAKRAAQMIRAENQALQEAANDTLSKLREAAEAARAASENSQAAADRHAASIEKRLASLAQTAAVAKKPAPAPLERPAERAVERAVERQVERAVERPAPRIVERPVERVAAVAAAPQARPPAQPAPQHQVAAHAEQTALYAAAQAAIARRAPVQPAPETLEERFERGHVKGMAGWGNFMPPSTPEPANNDDMDAFDLVDFGAPTPRDPDADLKAEAIDLVEAAGVDLGEALGAADLDRIAQRSRHGAAARRRAVADAAPGAVGRIARYVKRNMSAQTVANEFRARPDLAKSEDKATGKELVRAYLLIDAALG